MAVIIRPGLLIDGTGAPAATGMEVVVAEGKIEAVRPVGEGANGAGEVLSLPEGTLTPGLIDPHMHTIHWGQPVGVPYQRISTLECGLRGIRNAALLLDMGVTTIRDVAARENLSIQLRDLIRAGEVPGPRMFATGTMIECEGRADYALAGLHVTGANEARAAARVQLRAGADWIKIMATAGVGGGTGALVGAPGWQELTEEEIHAAVVEAHNAGRKAAAHAIGTDGIKASLRAGIDSIEHGSYLDSECIELLVENDVSLIPTLLVNRTLGYEGEERGYEKNIVESAKRTLDVAFESVAAARAAGVRIAAGSDAQLDETVTEEMRLLVQAGFGPMDALLAATKVAAEVLGIADATGTIESGKFADLAVFEGNPLEDMSALDRVSHVFLEGRIVKGVGEESAREVTAVA